MYVIGTAGHVDHGKSTLIEALTGTHPDRLKEEQLREMTIDLGFAWLNLPDGQEIGIIDVPGHRDFIENMLSGIGGIDLVLFVVAADEGVMPQTREHLAILDLLQISSGIIALTKTDLVDEEWIELVVEEIRQIVRHTILESAPIIPVSARSGKGIDLLIETLSISLNDVKPRKDFNRPRLPIDRVFTITGFGSVVTGTLIDGGFTVGEEISIMPRNLRGRIRGLQTHKKKVQVAIPGSRTAMNISGVGFEQIFRGDVICHPGDYIPTQRLDVSFNLIPEASQSIKHNSIVKIFLNTSEVMGRIRLLGTDELLPGHSGWLQLETNDPIICNRGDHYIVRRPSPGETIGGGIILDPLPKRRYKRFSAEIIAKLEQLSVGTPTEILFQSLLDLGFTTVKELVERSRLTNEQGYASIIELYHQGSLIPLSVQSEKFNPVDNTIDKSPNFHSNELITSKTKYDQLISKIVSEVENYHRTFPLRAGIPKEELRSRIKSLIGDSPKLFTLIIAQLIHSGNIEDNGTIISKKGFIVQFNPGQEKSISELTSQFRSNPFSPPSSKECIAVVGEAVYQALIENGRLVAVSPEVVFMKADYELMIREVIQLITDNKSISAAQVRDHFNTSRKYALALLEHMDSFGITIRDGDIRRLKS